MSLICMAIILLTFCLIHLHEYHAARKYRDMLCHWYFELGEPQTVDELMDGFDRWTNKAKPKGFYQAPYRVDEVLEFGRLYRLGRTPSVKQVGIWRNTHWRALPTVLGVEHK